MARYDGGWARGYGRDFGSGGPWANPRGRGAEWGGPRPGARGPRGPSGGLYGGGGYDLGRYDRGIYGEGYPGLRGYPGAAPSGRGYGGYDAPYAERPFIPEEAYRRHPEFDGPPRHVAGRWPDGPAGQGGAGFAQALEDEDVRQFVRESLYGDSWLTADKIEVDVREGVVTLRGEVADYMEARYAWDDAWESPGVRGVVNQLTVSAQPEAGE